MRIVRPRDGEIFLGAQGENLATRVLFPVAKLWKETYGQGIFQLLLKRHGEEIPYACVVTIEGDDVAWDITNTEVAVVGIGTCELYYYVGNTIAISHTYVTKVVASIADVGDTPPEPWESWIEEVLDAGSRAEAAATAAEGHAESAETSATSAQQSAGEAAEQVTLAEQQVTLAEAQVTLAEAQVSLATQKAQAAAQSAAEADETAQSILQYIEVAEEAKEAAEAAEQGAQTYAGNASTSATNAAASATTAGAAQTAAETARDASQGYAQAAEAAKDGAVTAKNAAVTAKEAAEAARDEAEEYAEGVSTLIQQHNSSEEAHPYLQELIAEKQNVITDLSTIRAGAQAGATALQEESDPTVPAWAKNPTKPSYTASEITDNTTTVAAEISDINGKISAQATSTNKLVSLSEMGDAIESVEAKQLYATSAQGSFATKAALSSATTFYNADGTVATPTKNDVAYVLADEDHSGKSAKYVIASVVGSTITWGFVITFSDVAFTQAQMDAINSNITDTKRQGYDSHVANGGIHVTAEEKTALNSISHETWTFTLDNDTTVTKEVVIWTSQT